MIRVLLVDDQPLVRAGLRLILEPEGAFVSAGECDDGDQVLSAVDRLRPDVVVMDVRMRRMGGFFFTNSMAPCRRSPLTISSTNPISCAFCAGIVLPLVIMRTASAIGTMRGSRWVPPEPGRMPSFTSGRPNCVRGSATR